MRPADPGVVGDLERILSPDRVLSRAIDRLGRSADDCATYLSVEVPSTRTDLRTRSIAGEPHAVHLAYT